MRTTIRQRNEPPGLSRRCARLGMGILLGLAGCQGLVPATVAPPLLRGAPPRALVTPGNGSSPPIESHQGAEAPRPPGQPCEPSETTITLPAALEAAGADNPTVGLAQEAVRAGLAELAQVEAMVLPTIDVGVSYNWHQGRLQSAQGVVQDVSRQSLYAGAGAFAVGAGTVAIPGLRATAHLADAWFAPAAARQAVAGADFTAQAVRNDVLLEVAVRYFDLVGAEARVEALRQSEREFAAAAKLTADVARTGQGREADARRAEADALLLHVQTVQAEEATATAAADLARLLSRDPACRLRPGEAVVVPVHLVPPEVPLAELVRTALQNRPEVAAAVAAIGVGEARWQQECVRPFLPLVAVGFSAGRFGGGSDQEDTRFGHFHGRTDFDVLAVWSLDGLGFGNWAAARRWRAVAAEAAAERVRVEDRISAEVAEAVAQSAARREALAVAQRQAARAATAYQEDLARARNLEGRPIELLNSLNLLATARQELIRAVSGYNQAQFRLFVALGRPATLAGGATP